MTERYEDHLSLPASLNASSPLPKVCPHDIPGLSVINQFNIDRVSSQKYLSKRKVVQGDFLERDLVGVK